MTLISFLRRRFRRGQCIKLVCLLCAFVATATFFSSTSNYLPLRHTSLHESMKIRLSQLGNSSGHGDRCVPPQMELWPPSFRAMFTKPKPLDCYRAEDNWVYVDKGTFQISPAAVKSHGAISCVYTPLKRGGDDFTTIWGDPVKDIKSGTPIQTDFFKVDCTASDKKTYFNIHAGIAPVPDPTEGPSSGSQKALGLNVLMIGFDSVSRLTWMRSVPKTYDYLVNVLGTTVLEGYNIVGDGTPQALLPILTGKTEWELPEARRGQADAKPVDGHPWIWDELKKLGYVTQFAEDCVHIGTFTYRMKGFKEQPVDHYMRTYYIESEKIGGLSRRLCTGSLPRHVVFLNYARDLFRTYPARTRKFSFLFQGELSHDSTSLMQLVDADLVEFLKDMNVKGHLDNTVLIMMSDHGARFSSVRQSVQGKLEERNPFMSIRFPPSFARNHPEAMKNLRTNAHRLSTPFDMHATLEDIVSYSATMRGDVTQRGISLLTEIPEARTCKHADIEPHWCACLAWNKIDAGDKMAVRAAGVLLATINALTEGQRTKCETLTLTEISLAVRYAPNESVLKFKKSKDNDGRVPDLSDNMNSDAMYQVTIVTKPNDGHYEGTLSYNQKEDKFRSKEADISRTNKYGKQPHCIMNELPRLRKYCYCKVQTT